MSSTQHRPVIWVYGGEGYPPDHVLAGLEESASAVATVHLRGGKLDNQPELLARARALGPLVAVEEMSEIATAGPLL